MTDALIDTTVILHLFRQYKPALDWYETLTEQPGITPVIWLEVMYGAGSKVKQATCKALLDQCEMIYLTAVDQDWAMKQMGRFRLSHGITMADCLIASVATRLQVTLFTHNLKDMLPMIGELASQPYG
jgi:predicted nucleic acid-binding protein